MISQREYDKRYNEEDTFMDTDNMIWSRDPKLRELEIRNYIRETGEEPRIIVKTITTRKLGTAFTGRF